MRTEVPEFINVKAIERKLPDFIERKILSELVKKTC